MKEDNTDFNKTLDIQFGDYINKAISSLEEILKKIEKEEKKSIEIQFDKD